MYSKSKVMGLNLVKVESQNVCKVLTIPGTTLSRPEENIDFLLMQTWYIFEELTVCSG